MNYKESNAINYSILSALVSHPREAKAMIDGVDKTSSGFAMGNLIDFLLTSKEPYTNKYLLVTSKPSGSLLTLADEYIRLTDGLVLNNTEHFNYILTARRNVGYDSRLKDETVITKFVIGCTEYVKAFEQAKKEDKEIIDAETLEYAQNLVASAQYDPVTSFYLNEVNFDAYFTQLELYGTIAGTECKGKPDIVTVNNSTKLITVVDVKTYNGNFLKNFWAYHYYIQTPLYGELFKQTYPEYADYEISYINLTIDTSGNNSPEIFILSPILVHYVLEDLDKVLNDTIDIQYTINEFSSRKIPTIPKLINDLNYHISTDNWEHTKDYLGRGFNIIE